MVILDGKYVEANLIDPKKHRYLGMWRNPFETTAGVGGGYVACSCGAILQSFDQGREHWQAGHFDYPQYQTVEKGGS